MRPNFLFIVTDQQRWDRVGFDRPVRLSTLITATWRLTVWESCDWGELYDLENDPHELHNLWNVPALRPTRERLTLDLIHSMQNHQDSSPFPTDKG